MPSPLMRAKIAKVLIFALLVDTSARPDKDFLVRPAGYQNAMRDP